MNRIKLILAIVFVMLVSPLAAAYAQDDVQITPISYGESLDGTITSVDQGNIYSFVGQAGDQIIIDATSTKIDTYLRLGDAEANILAENDDAESGVTDARIEFTLPTKGTYYFAVVGYTTGPYTVTLSVNDGQQSQGQQEDLLQIAYGETVSGSLANADDGVVYLFSGTQGDEITLAATSTDADVFLWLGDGEANQLATNDDIAAKNTNAQIDFTLPETGDYLVVVMAYSAGSYELTLTNNSAATNNQQGQTQNTGNNTFPTIAYGETVEGTTIDLENPVIYGFTGKAGDVVTIQASSATVDTYLLVVDAEANLVGENDDASNTDTNAQLQVTLPADGTYYVGVLGYTAGPFTLSISSGKGGSVNSSNVSQQMMGNGRLAGQAEGK